MDIDVARHMIRVAFATSRELQDLMALLKKQLSAEEYTGCSREISSAIAGIGDALTNKALQAHLELRNEIEQKLLKYGRFI